MGAIEGIFDGEVDVGAIEGIFVGLSIVGETVGSSLSEGAFEGAKMHAFATCAKVCCAPQSSDGFNLHA